VEQQEYDYFVAHEFSRQERDDLREAVEKAFESTDLNAYYADIEVRQSPTHILDKIKDRIFRTRFGIYDITYTKKPNVFIELGLAMAAERPLYIICKKGTEIPADLAGLDRIEYESYKELTELIRAKIVKDLNKPKIEITVPSLTRVNSWDEKDIRQWLKHPIGRGEGHNDFLYELQGKVCDAPPACEVRIWVHTTTKWSQIGGPVSENDGTWSGRIFLHMEDVEEFTRKERADIGIDVVKQGTDLLICSAIFTVQ